MLKKQIDFIVSSNPLNGALNLSSDGSTFNVQYEEPLTIPKEAKNVTVEVQNAEIWWTVPNVITGENDKFRLIDTNAGSNPSGTAYTGTVTIPEGLYDLSALSNTLETLLVNAGSAQGTFTLSADEATQKVQIIFNNTGVSIDFTIANSCRDLLGWTSVVVGPHDPVPYTDTAPNIASFNQINYFLIHSDLVDRGLRYNNKYSQIMTQVLIDVSPGSQITYTPQWPAVTDGSHLRGAKRNYFRYWLTDDQDRLVNTASEYWSARIVIKYYIPIELA